MVMKYAYQSIFLVLYCLLVLNCKGQSSTSPNSKESPQRIFYSVDRFVMGVDLSYVNQILDHKGVYQDSAEVENPYTIFREYGANVARFRLWHDPEWTSEVYGGAGNPQYHNLSDVTRAIREAKAKGMAVNLDFHYSDNWADPSTQEVPEDWNKITTLEVLKDSVYRYTLKTLRQLNQQGLMPEMVQIGNETNCGMMYSNASPSFPALNVCEGNWQNLGTVINSGIQAVREVSENSGINTKVILHIAQPENVKWWFNHITSEGGVTDFDIIGLSYYTLWSDVSLTEVSEYISAFKNNFSKEVMIVETAYPWTLENNDSYNNIFGTDSLIEGFPATPEGQQDFMIALVKEVIAGGGMGVIYWEPAWITSDMKDKWGTGSSWENNTFFDFKGKVHSGINYMTYDYEL